MGRIWRPYNVGRYHLGSLYDKKRRAHQAVVRWKDERGISRRAFLDVFSEGEARAALDQWVALRHHLKKAIDTPTVGDIWELYYADRAKDGKKMRAFADNWLALKGRFANMRVSDITDDVCRDYTTERMRVGRIIRKGDGSERSAPLSLGTPWTELLRLRSCINWAHSRHHISVKPHIWLPKKPPARQDVLRPEEFVALLNACCEPHTRLFCMIAITTAARSGAILDLQWNRVDFQGKALDFRTGQVSDDPLSKAVRKTRVVGPMTSEVEMLLIDAQRRSATPFVVEYDFKPVQCIRKSFKAAVRRAGLSRSITPHTLRHTALTWLDEAGVPPQNISRLAGHSRTAITEAIYIKTQMAKLRGSSEILERIVVDGGFSGLQIENSQPGDAK